MRGITVKPGAEAELVESGGDELTLHERMGLIEAIVRLVYAESDRLPDHAGFEQGRPIFERRIARH